jgi:methionyl-tRNA formyltransferase
MRLIFMGTPDFAVPALIELAARGHDIAAVYTRAPKPAGRGMDVQVTPVAREALRLSIPVLTPATLKTDEAQAAFAAHKAEAAVVVAYGLILPKPVLDAVPLGCFNIHASILPRWRGAAPINRAIMAGDAESGVSIMRMDEGLDTGDVAMIERVAIKDDMTAGELHDALAPLGADAMLRSLAALERDSLQFTPQPKEDNKGGVTYAEKIQKSETRIDWSQPWQAVHNHIRGLSPHPGAWFELADSTRVRARKSTKGEGQENKNAAPGTVLDDRLTIACGDGAVRLVEVQRAGKQPMTAADFLRGTAVAKGTVLN